MSVPKICSFSWIFGMKLGSLWVWDFESVILDSRKLWWSFLSLNFWTINFKLVATPLTRIQNEKQHRNDHSARSLRSHYSIAHQQILIFHFYSTHGLSSCYSASLPNGRSATKSTTGIPLTHMLSVGDLLATVYRFLSERHASLTAFKPPRRPSFRIS